MSTADWWAPFHEAHGSQISKRNPHTQVSRCMTSKRPLLCPPYLHQQAPKTKKIMVPSHSCVLPNRRHVYISRNTVLFDHGITYAKPLMYLRLFYSISKRTFQCAHWNMRHNIGVLATRSMCYGIGLLFFEGLQ